MVDSQSENERRIKLERIIASIKQSNHNDYRVDQANETDSCFKDGPINAGQKNKLLKSRSPLNTQSNITNYFAITKNATDVRSSSKDVTIRSLLNSLKTNKENNIVTIFEDNSAKVNTGSYRVQNSCSDKTSGCNILINEVIRGKHERDEQLNTSAEVIRKTHNYHKKQNNKRLKSCDNTKQLFVTDFFNVDRVRSNETKNKTGNEVAEKNSMANNAVNEMCCDKNVVKLRSKNENSIRESVRKNCVKGVHANKNVSLKDKNDENKTTFDDFCKNVISVIDENSKGNKKADDDESKKQLHYLCKTSNFLPKSYSTGYLIGNNERKSCKDLSSLPITDIEIKSRKEKLAQSKITFDDFMKNILKDINTSIIESDSGKNIDVSDTSEENNNAKGNNRNVNHVTERLGSDDAAPTVMDKVAKHSASEFNNENIIQKRNSNGSEQNLELSHKDFEKGKDKHMDKIDESGEAKESESEDFLSYFPKNWSESNNLKESPVELLKDETKNLTDLDCNEHDYALPPQDIFALNVCNEISREISPQENSDATQLRELIKEKQFISEGDNLEAQSTCEYLNFSESNTYVESINQNSILSESGIIRTRSTEQSENNKTDKLDRFLLKLLQQNTTRNIDENHKNTASKKKIYIKRYRKGKTKIYRLKKLKKISPKTKVLQEEEKNLNFDDVFKKITQDIVTAENNCLSRSRSMSSISTSSSYITDVTRSEILSTGSNELSSPEQRLRKGFNYLSKDKSLLFCEEQWENSTEYDKEEIKMKIQEIVSRVVEDFSQKNGSSLKYRKQSFDNCVFKDGRLQLKPVAEASVTVINSRAQRSQARFMLILYILKKIQNLLETDTKLTKRELYYQLKTSVKDQRITDRAINAISCLLDVGMWALNIIAQKGLVFGNLKILLSSGETLNCNIPGTQIPQDINDIVEIESPAYFILVVEKESIFYKLIEEDLPNRLTRPFIMITGKGFPDLNTQLFLKKLWMIMSIPVFILVDADPHGINIMLNYRFGSVNNAHVSHQLAVPQAKWLGVYPSEVINLNITRELLSERELKLVSDLLKTPYMSCNPRIVNELEVLLEKKYKAEIEGLIKSDTYLSEVYLPNKFFTHNFI